VQTCLLIGEAKQLRVKKMLLSLLWGQQTAASKKGPPFGPNYGIVAYLL